MTAAMVPVLRILGVAVQPSIYRSRGTAHLMDDAELLDQALVLNNGADLVDDGILVDIIVRPVDAG